MDDAVFAPPPTYRSLCIEASVKPNTALLKTLGGDARELSMVKVIDLSRYYVGPKHLDLIGRLIVRGALGELEVIDVSGNDVPTTFVFNLCEALLNTPTSLVPALRSIVARGVFMSRGDATALLNALRASPLITKVDLAGSDVAPDIVEAIAVEVEIHVQQQYSAVTNTVAVAPRSKSASIASFTAFKEEVAVPPAAVAAALSTPPTTVVVAPVVKPAAVPLSSQLTDDVEWLTNCADLERFESRLEELASFAHLFDDEPRVIAPPTTSAAATAVTSSSHHGATAPAFMITMVASAESSPTSNGLGSAQEAPLASSPGATVIIDTVPKFASVQETIRRLIQSTSLHAGDAPRDGDETSSMQMHVDSEFPPAPCSLVSAFRPPTSNDAAFLEAAAKTPAPFTIGGRQVSWRRLTADPKCTNPRFYAGSPTPIVTGQVAATEWLANAMRLVSLSRCAQAALQSLCVKGHPDLGVYCIVLRKTDATVTVVIDDYMPVDHATGEWLCTRSEDPNELWPALVEKAMAKIHGGYDRLSCGSLRTGIMDLIGGAVSKISWSLKSAKAAISNGELFEFLHKKVELQLGETILAAVPRAHGHLEQQAIRATGLYPNTVYIVDKTYACSSPPANLIRLRQPAPDLVWQGRFGPDSAELKEDSLRQRLGWSADLRGRFFWMTLEDFAAFFGNLYTTQWHVPSDDSTRCVTAHQTLQWLQAQHAGPVDWDPMWMQSPTVGIRVQAKNTPVTLHCTVPDQRLKRGQPLTYPFSTQMLVLARPSPPPVSIATDGDSAVITSASSQSPDKRSDLNGTFGKTLQGMEAPAADRLHRDWDLNRDVVFKSAVCSARDIVAEVTMQPGIDYYVVVGFAGVAAVRYGLRISSLGRVGSCVVEDNTAVNTLEWEWASHSAGGAAFNAFLSSRVPPLPVAPTPRAAQNPQISLRVKRDGPVTLVLALRGSALSRITFGTSTGPRGGAASPTSTVTTPSKAVLLSSINSVTSITSTGFNSLNIGFAVCRAPSALSSVDQITEKLVAATNYVNLQSVSLHLQLTAGTYIIIPCTYLAGVEVEFAMHAFATVPLELKKASL